MNADKLSGVKTFTIRELDRTPTVVLDDCDLEGAVKIRRRDGRTYTLRADAGPDRMTSVPDIRARLAKLFPKPLSRAQTRRADKLMAGE